MNEGHSHHRVHIWIYFPSLSAAVCITGTWTCSHSISLETQPTEWNPSKMIVALNFGRIQEEGKERRSIKMVLARQATPFGGLKAGFQTCGIHSDLYFKGEG